jgi:hypothetical protein
MGDMMQRPHSILLFERLYLAAWAIGLISTIVTWQASQEMVMRNPAIAQIGPGFLYATTAVRLLLPLLLWYLVARRASVVAKWLLVGLFAIGVLGLGWAVAMGTIRLNTGSAVTALVFALQAAAVAMLFRADATAWFARTDEADAPA